MNNNLSGTIHDLSSKLNRLTNLNNARNPLVYGIKLKKLKERIEQKFKIFEFLQNNAKKPGQQYPFLETNGDPMVIRFKMEAGFKKHPEDEGYTFFEEPSVIELHLNNPALEGTYRVPDINIVPDSLEHINYKREEAVRSALKSLVIAHNGLLTAIRKTKVDYLRNNYPELQTQFVGGRFNNPEEELAKLDAEMMEIQGNLK